MALRPRDLRTKPQPVTAPVPEGFTCAVTGRILRDPVITSDGQVYERAVIQEWLRQGHRTSPSTGKALASQKLREHPALKLAIATFLQHDVEERSGLEDPGMESGAGDAADALESRSILMLAAAQGREDLVRLLLEERAAPDARDRGGCSALMHAAAGGHLEATGLLSSVCELEARSSQGWTALALAAATGRADVVRMLAGAGASVNALDGRDWSPLMHAAFARQFSACCALLELGASALQTDAAGRSALALAACQGDLEVVRVLLDFHPATGDEQAGVALHCAVLRDHAEMVRHLLRTAIPPQMRGQAMRLALEHGHHEIVETLARASVGKRPDRASF